MSVLWTREMGHICPSVTTNIIPFDSEVRYLTTVCRGFRLDTWSVSRPFINHLSVLIMLQGGQGWCVWRRYEIGLVVCRGHIDLNNFGLGDINPDFIFSLGLHPRIFENPFSYTDHRKYSLLCRKDSVSKSSPRTLRVLGRAPEPENRRRGSYVTNSGTNRETLVREGTETSPRIFTDLYFR